MQQDLHYLDARSGDEILHAYENEHELGYKRARQTDMRLQYLVLDDRHAQT